MNILFIIINKVIKSTSTCFQEILKATVDFADLFGLYLALNSVPGKGHAKILTAAIGWASAEVNSDSIIQIQLK